MRDDFLTADAVLKLPSVYIDITPSPDIAQHPLTTPDAELELFTSISTEHGVYIVRRVDLDALLHSAPPGEVSVRCLDGFVMTAIKMTDGTIYFPRLMYRDGEAREPYPKETETMKTSDVQTKANEIRMDLLNELHAAKDKTGTERDKAMDDIERRGHVLNQLDPRGYAEAGSYAATED